MKTYIGRVVSNKMKDTVTIEREIAYLFPVFKKIIRRTRKVKAHTKFPLSVGTVVKFKETVPISKEKHFEVIEIVKTDK